MPVTYTHPVAWDERGIVPIKPRLRGWIHLVTTPLALVATLVLVFLAPTTATTVAAAIYLVASVTLFGMSALYHLFYWSPRVESVLRRSDHSNIFLLIAGTYTPVAVGCLNTSSAAQLLTVVWVGAIAGIVLTAFSSRPPRWLTAIVYLLLGWVAVWYLPSLWREGGAAVVVLLVVGGLFYTVGALIYATKRPNPSPQWFGFHEIFHACTVAAWACHCVAAYLAVLT